MQKPASSFHDEDNDEGSFTPPNQYQTLELLHTYKIQSFQKINGPVEIKFYRLGRCFVRYLSMDIGHA